MFGLFRKQEIVSRWRFHGKPDRPGVLVYSREGGTVDGIVGAWLFALAVSKTLFTVGRTDVTSAACLQFMDYSMKLQETSNPFDLSLFVNDPKPLDAEQRFAERIPLHRSYVYEFVANSGGDLPRLETTWPREYSPADVLSIFRLMAHDCKELTQQSMGAHLSRAVFVLLFQQIAIYYGNDEGLHTKPSSIVAVPSMAIQHVMQSLEQVMSGDG